MERITLDELRAEVARIEATDNPEDAGAVSVVDIAEQLNIPRDRARGIVKEALAAGLMKLVTVKKTNMIGTRRRYTMYQPVAKPENKPNRAKKK